MLFRSGSPLGASTGLSDVQLLELEEGLEVTDLDLSAAQRRTARGLLQEVQERIEQLRDRKDRELSQLRRGDDLPSGVLEMVKVYVATKRRLSVGDKMEIGRAHV